MSTHQQADDVLDQILEDERAAALQYLRNRGENPADATDLVLVARSRWSFR